MTDDRQAEFRRRDATSVGVLGAFFVILGTLVAIGTFWTGLSETAGVVNLGSGLLLVIIGGAAVTWSRRSTSRAARSPDDK
jgi:hypothetical protein